MDPRLARRLTHRARYHNTGERRPLSELPATNETLKGIESQRLRTFCTSECIAPSRWWIHTARYSAPVTLLAKICIIASCKRLRNLYLGPKMMTPEEAGEVVAREYMLFVGPTDVPVCNFLGLLSLISLHLCSNCLAIARFLIRVTKVPVDGRSFWYNRPVALQPGFDLGHAQMLYVADGDVNHGNQYGGVVAHEILQVWTPQNKEVVRKVADALEWFLDRGG